MTAGKGKNLLWRLLRKHVSPLQLAGFSIASLVGLTIVVLALQFYVDVKPVFSDEDSFARRDYIVVTKHVSGLGSMFGTGVEFSESDIADLENQPWVREVGRFTTSEYGIYASVMFGGRWIPRFAIFTKSNGHFAFSTKDNKRTLRAVREHVPADRLLRSLGFFDVVKSGIMGLFHRR